MTHWSQGGNSRGNAKPGTVDTTFPTEQVEHFRSTLIQWAAAKKDKPDARRLKAVQLAQKCGEILERHARACRTKKELREFTGFNSYRGARGGMGTQLREDMKFCRETWEEVKKGVREIQGR